MPAHLTPMITETLLSRKKSVLYARFSYVIMEIARDKPLWGTRCGLSGRLRRGAVGGWLGAGAQAAVDADEGREGEQAAEQGRQAADHQ
jgi:hypothetical protein